MEREECLFGFGFVMFYVKSKVVRVGEIVVVNFVFKRFGFCVFLYVVCEFIRFCKVLLIVLEMIFVWFFICKRKIIYVVI